MDIESEDLNRYNVQCNKIVVREPRDKMILICKKYQRFLHNCLTWSDLNPDFDVSLLLSFWLYEKLIKIYGGTNTQEITSGFSALQGTWANFFNYDRIKDSRYLKCKPEPKMLNQEDWVKRKQLFEYYVNYDTLYRTASLYLLKCQENYEKIKEFSSLYEYFRGECLTEGYECPKVFPKFESEKREYNLEILPCHKQMEKAIAAAAQVKASSHHPEGAEQRHGASNDGPEKPGSKFIAPDTQITLETTDIKTKVANSVLGAAPVILTATALYRYTRLGPWLRRIGGGRTNNMNSMDTFSPYTEETGDMFSNNSENYISYQPI
ncbi:hypothetical protein PVBG_06038 [Plasmodium vivax Brazil I]|uniref:VIR protein n=1 Tax=Plasmodium vivax (strain Brazil I) TaxID=1033975 RepID=A0A0J9SL64_PLAV1|nr:hypothetical protein PVBG_06038 [Plasmodium vivax Brazil I]